VSDTPAPPVSRAPLPRAAPAGSPTLPVSFSLPSLVTRPPARSPPTTVRPIPSPLTRSPARLAPCAPAQCARAIASPPACPSRPVAILCHHHRHGELTGARHSSSLPPPRPPIKGPPRAPCSTTLGLNHSASLPRAQSSSAPSSLPSLVSSVLLSIVAYDQIALALKVHRSVTSLAHTCLSPITPSGLAGDFTAASARHPSWTGHPRPPPVKLTPPP
jgi:hypothetical protein